MPSISLSRENTDVRKTVSQIKEEKLRTSEKADWITVSEETFDDDSRVKITVTKAEKINFSSETSFLLDMLKKDHPSSLVPMIEMPPAGSGRTPTGNFAYKEFAPFSNYMGNASGVGRQSATLPASQMGQ
ncbi:hypothetical protein Tco_1021045, partial [Tanacetum coccineum]